MGRTAACSAYTLEISWDACILGGVDAALSGGADIITVVGYAEKSIHALEQLDRILGYIAKLADEEVFGRHTGLPQRHVMRRPAATILILEIKEGDLR